MQSGVSLYLAILVMVILLAIVLGLTAILIGQMKMVREMGYSVIALSAADAGIERALMEWGDESDTLALDGTGDTLGEASYELSVFQTGPECTATNFCITSVGIYKGVRRAIEITY